jgi:hypothetical protein
MSTSISELIGRIIDPGVRRPPRPQVQEPTPDRESLDVLIGRIVSPGPGAPML